MPTSPKTTDISHRPKCFWPDDYVVLLEAGKDEIAASRVRAALAVNAELSGMYLRVGVLILEQQAAEGLSRCQGRSLQIVARIYGHPLTISTRRWNRASFEMGIREINEIRELTSERRGECCS